MKAQLKVVIIEDDQAMQSLIKDFLEMQGHMISGFRLAREALVFLDQNADVDLVISDINMPQMNGIEVVESLRRNRPSIPVVLITAFGNQSTQVRAKEAGASGFLNKPFRLSDLKEVIESAIRRVS